MYGLEKSKAAPASYALEDKIRKNPNKAEQIIADVHGKIAALKIQIRNAKNKQEAEELATIMQAYQALPKVLKNIKRKGA